MYLLYRDISYVLISTTLPRIAFHYYSTKNKNRFDHGEYAYVVFSRIILLLADGRLDALKLYV